MQDTRELPLGYKIMERMFLFNCGNTVIPETGQTIEEWYKTLNYKQKMEMVKRYDKKMNS